jgi:hypothetical protein
VAHRACGKQYKQYFKVTNPEDQPPSPRREPGGISVTVIRDIVVILVVPPMGGAFELYVTAPLLGNGFLRAIVPFASGLFLMTFGFTLSACLARGNRWHHIMFVAMGVWLLGELQSFLLDSSIFAGTKYHSHPQRGIDLLFWLACVIFVALVGGALSYLFKKTDSKPSSQA